MYEKQELMYLGGGETVVYDFQWKMEMNYTRYSSKSLAPVLLYLSITKPISGNGV